MLLDKEVRIVRWYCEPELPDGLIYCESKGMITGTPIVMFPKRDFQLFAQSVSCVSDGYKFSIEVAPSEEDVGLIVLKSIGTISSQVDAILQIDKVIIRKYALAFYSDQIWILFAHHRTTHILTTRTLIL